MGNMSYCRFENTANDLAECEEHFGDYDLSSSEANSRERILRIAKRIVADWDGQELNMDDSDDSNDSENQEDCSEDGA